MQKTDRTDDLRVQRTRALLQEALFALTVEKGFAAVTIRDITTRAKVNRSTFYRHYLDKYDLLSQYLDALQRHITSAATHAESSPPTSSEKVPAGLLILIQHIQEYADFYRTMLGPNGDAVFVHRFRQLSEDRFRYLFARQPQPSASGTAPVNLKLNYIAYAGMGAILWWLENHQPCSAEQLAVWLRDLHITSAGLMPPR